ncbi:MAG TPA: minor capsid protein [Candidatus Parasutterella gallistercoris]|nr:minor capsid protein [Candidatus Parasutterella gallistercoris]
MPMEAAKKAQEWAASGLSDGQRYADIAQRIKNELGGVTESRAICIARTETARARSNFTQARAQAVGSTHYVWHTVGDNAVRPRHRELDRTVHSWSDPPICDVGAGGTPIRSHPGCVFNCRCWPEPLFYEKDK